MRRSVREHVYGNACPIVICYLWSWLDPSLAALRYVMYFRFMDDVTSAHNGRKYTTRQRRTVVVIQQVWQRGFNAATNTSTDPPGAALGRRGRSLISKIASSIHCAQFAMLCTDDGFRVRACRLCFTCIPNDVHTASARHLGITAFVFSQIL